MAVDVEHIVLVDNGFGKQLNICFKCVLTVVKVLKLVDSDIKLVMAYMYEVMDKAKEQSEELWDGWNKVWEHMELLMSI